MIVVTILIIVLAAVIGLLIKMMLGPPTGRYSSSISWAEYTVVLAIMASIIAPSTTAIGKKLSVDEILRYEQFVNGVEKQPIDNVTTCVAGHSSNYSASTGRSNCSNTYVSGSYDYDTTCYRTVTTTTYDTKGNPTTTTTVESYPCTETALIYTPYATKEHTYAIPSSVGFKELPTFEFNGVYLDAKPVPYRANVPVPRDPDYPWGPPADWQDANNRYNAGDPRAVTALDDYDNYILASNDEVLKTYSNRIDQYKKAGLLPDHTASILKDPIKGPSRSQADKVSFVGVTVANPAEWQSSQMRYDAACGLKLQCDMRTVLVDCSKVPANDSVPYTIALKAYWQSPVFGKRAIAKNAVVLVLGVCNNTTIAWAEATTGMPHGNENMEQRIHDFVPATPLTPQSIFGTPRVMFNGNNPTITHPAPLGVVEDIMFNQVPLKRVRMECNDGTCVGYKDEISKIDPTPWQKFWIIFVSLVIATLLWWLVAATSGIDDLMSPYLEKLQRARVQYAPTDVPTRLEYGQAEETQQPPSDGSAWDVAYRAPTGNTSYEPSSSAHSRARGDHRTTDSEGEI